MSGVETVDVAAAEEVLSAIADCQVCGAGWPRLCGTHRDRFEEWLNWKIRQERAS